MVMSPANPKKKCLGEVIGLEGRSGDARSLIDDSEKETPNRILHRDSNSLSPSFLRISPREITSCAEGNCWKSMGKMLSNQSEFL